MPYHPTKSMTCQVGTSLTSSLKNLRHQGSGTQTRATQPYLDCLLLHAPFAFMTEITEA